jgi:hypothetical protein
MIMKQCHYCLRFSEAVTVGGRCPYCAKRHSIFERIISPVITAMIIFGVVVAGLAFLLR